MPSAPADYKADLPAHSAVFIILGIAFFQGGPSCLPTPPPWTLLFTDGVRTAQRLKPQWEVVNCLEEIINVRPYLDLEV